LRSDLREMLRWLEGMCAAVWTLLWSLFSRPCNMWYTISFIKSFFETFSFDGATAPSGPGPPHYRGFTMTLRHTTLGRTPLDEWSAQLRDIYLTTHNQGCGVGVGVVESEGILGGVGVGSLEKMYRLRLRPQSKILSRYSISRALIATVTIRLILKYRL
jgi:hypothetical protein